MDEVAAYLKDKIEHAVTFYEMAVSRVSPAYLAQVEKLAERTEDPVLADYFRKTMQPHSIVSALADIRGQLKAGQIIEADRAFENLKANVEAVEIRLRHPIFRTGAKQWKYLGSVRAKANAEKKRVADERHREWRAAAQSYWARNPGHSVPACADSVIRKLKPKIRRSKTVEDVIRHLRPK